MSWTMRPRRVNIPRLCRFGVHVPGGWKTNVEPDYNAEVTLVVKRRYCERCKAMQYKELERHG